MYGNNKYICLLGVDNIGQTIDPDEMQNSVWRGAVSRVNIQMLFIACYIMIRVEQDKQLDQFVFPSVDEHLFIIF